MANPITLKKLMYQGPQLNNKCIYSMMSDILANTVVVV